MKVSVNSKSSSELCAVLGSDNLGIFFKSAEGQKIFYLNSSGEVETVQETDLANLLTEKTRKAIHIGDSVTLNF